MAKFCQLITRDVVDTITTVFRELVTDADQVIFVGNKPRTELAVRGVFTC